MYDDTINYDVTVMLLTYNHINYVRQAIDSVLNQNTSFKYNIFIHDDCSTDGTTSVLKEYEEKYSNIKCFYEVENQFSKGNNTFMKRLYQISNAKYLATLECDDYWIDVNKLQIQYDFLENNNDYSAVGHLTRCIDRGGIELENTFVSTVRSGEFNINSIKKWKLFAHYSSYFFRKKCVSDKGIDMLYSFKKCPGDRKYPILFLQYGKLYVIDKTMSVYRFQSCETSFTYVKSKNLNFYNSYLECIDCELFFEKFDKIVSYKSRKNWLYTLAWYKKNSGHKDEYEEIRKIRKHRYLDFFVIFYNLVLIFFKKILG